MKIKLITLFLNLFCLGSIYGQNSNCKLEYDSILKMTVYTSVDIKPSFPGGNEEMTIFIRNNFKYIETEGIYGSANLIFIVNEDGAISNITPLVFNDILTPLEKELIRVFTIMPKWMPGKCNGKAVSSKVYFNFKL